MLQLLAAGAEVIRGIGILFYKLCLLGVQGVLFFLSTVLTEISILAKFLYSRSGFEKCGLLEWIRMKPTSRGVKWETAIRNDGRDMSGFYKQTKRINVKEWNELFKIKEYAGAGRYAYKLPLNENKPWKWLV